MAFQTDRIQHPHRQKSYITLRRRLLFYFVTVSLLSSILFFAFYLARARENLLDNLLEESGMQLEHVMENVESLTSQTGDFVNRLARDRSILALLERPEKEADVYNVQNEEAISVLLQQVTYFQLNRYMLSVTIRGRNGTDIRRGLEGYLLTDEDITKLLNTETDSQHWCALTPNPNRLTDFPDVIPYHQTVYHPYTHRPLGDILLLFSPDLFLHLPEEEITSHIEFFALYNQKNELLCAIGAETSTLEEADGESSHGSVETRSEAWNLSVDAHSSVREWTAAVRVSSEVLRREYGTILQSAVLLLLLVSASSVYLSILMSRYFTDPIYRMGERVERIAQGDFSGTPPVGEPKNEIDVLERKIQKMGEDISMLMEQQEEKQKLELRMLQDQLNPHFLNNTLNTIRVMATLQGKSSIAGMIEALGTLVRANLRSSKEILTLEEETALLESYLYIQNVRMNGLLETRIEIPEELMHFRVLKFILQPVAENAILHGIGNDPLGGTIAVKASTEDDILWISVEDSGKGIPPEQLREIQDSLQNPSFADAAERAHGTALPNLQMRIRMRWGERYGVTVFSEEGAGTKVLLCLPVLQQEEADLEEDTDCG